MRYTGPKEIKYLFVDGGCIRQFIKDASLKYPGISIDDIEWKNLLGTHSKMFYYDSLPVKKKNETTEDFEIRVAQMESIFDALRTVHGIHVYEGDARRRRAGVQQKKVDIMISVDMLTPSFRGNMHQATLFTADLDFKPLVDALVRDGMNVSLWYPHGKPNRELIYAADQRLPLTFKNLYNWTRSSYKEMFPSPKAISKGGKHVDGGRLVECWETKAGAVAELFFMKDENAYLAVFPSRLNQKSNHHTHVSHVDKDILKTYVLECFEEFWDRPI